MADKIAEARTVAIKHIGISTYSSGKIRKYLIDRGFEDSIVSEVVTDLIVHKYIDDYKACRKVLYLRTGKHQESRDYCYKRLISSGIDENIAQEYVTHLLDDIDSIQILFDSIIDSVDKLNEDTYLRWIYTYSRRRGYSFDIAKRGLDLWCNKLHK